MSISAVCNVCKESTGKRVATIVSDLDGATYDVMSCRNCGLQFVFPLPPLTLERLQEVYGAEYTTRMRRFDDSSEGYEVLRTATHRQMELVERYLSKGRALNVGAMGEASRVIAERGWALQIIEPSAYAAETARQLWGMEVVVTRIEDYQTAPESLDFVKLGHVIEHLQDPHAVLSRLSSFIRPGGGILIDTDNADSLKTRIENGARRLAGESVAAGLIHALTGKNLRKRYGGLRPPEHVYSFTETSLTRLLTATGFEPLMVVKPAWGNETWFPLANKTQFSRFEKVFIGIDQVGALFGAGNVLAVLARKR